MVLNFTNEYYKSKAFESNRVKNKNDNYTIYDSFLILIKDINILDLENLCNLIKIYYGDKNISKEEAYLLTQQKDIPGKIKFDESVKKVIYVLANECIEKQKTLGNNTIMEGKINTSSWISHSIFESRLMGQFAEKLNLDVNKAKKLGLLHDIGRKKTHSFEHTIKGFELLIDENFQDEAIGCLTHSFLGGGRCASNEQAEPGFYVDENGNPNFKSGTIKDDVTLFLENYKYTKYDILLNIADLMASDKGIISPLDRIIDIASRRKSFDSANRSYFLAELTNYLLIILNELHVKIPSDLQYKVKADKNTTLEEITKKFEEASNLFFDVYKKFIDQETINDSFNMNNIKI